MSEIVYPYQDVNAQACVMEDNMSCTALLAPWQLPQAFPIYRPEPHMNRVGRRPISRVRLGIGTLNRFTLLYAHMVHATWVPPKLMFEMYTADRMPVRVAQILQLDMSGLSGR